MNKYILQSIREDKCVCADDGLIEKDLGCQDKSSGFLFFVLTFFVVIFFHKGEMQKSFDMER